MKTNQDPFLGEQPSNQIWYTTSNQKTLTPWTTQHGPKIISDEYIGQKGVITFDRDLDSKNFICFDRCDIGSSDRLTAISFPDCFNFDECDPFRLGGGVVKGTIYLNLERIKYKGGDGRNLIHNNMLIAVANSNLETYEFPAVAEIAKEVFIGEKDKLKKVIVQKGTVLREGALTGLSALEKIIGEKSTRSCKSWIEGDTLVAFAPAGSSDCEIREGVRRIGSGAFQTSSLRTIKIPGSLNEIDRDAFGDIWGLKMRGANVARGGEFLVVDGELLMHSRNPRFGYFNPMVVPNNVNKISGMQLRYSKYIFPDSLQELRGEIVRSTTLQFKSAEPPRNLHLYINPTLYNKYYKKMIGWMIRYREWKQDPEGYRQGLLLLRLALPLLGKDELEVGCPKHGFSQITIEVPQGSEEAYKRALRNLSDSRFFHVHDGELHRILDEMLQCVRNREVRHQLEREFRSAREENIREMIEAEFRERLDAEPFGNLNIVKVAVAEETV